MLEKPADELTSILSTVNTIEEEIDWNREEPKQTESNNLINKAYKGGGKAKLETFFEPKSTTLPEPMEISIGIYGHDVQKMEFLESKG